MPMSMFFHSKLVVIMQYLYSGSYTQNKPLSRRQYASFRGVIKPTRQRPWNEAKESI